MHASQPNMAPGHMGGGNQMQYGGYQQSGGPQHPVNIPFLFANLSNLHSPSANFTQGSGIIFELDEYRERRD